ncbi:Dr family adhesin structural subunit, partial [Escherichia coli]
GSAWNTNGDTVYRADAGNWGGNLLVVVDGDNVDKPAGSYILNLDGGYWVS